MADGGTVRVVDVPERSRYEVSVDGEVAGYAAYDPAPGHVTFTHTVVDPAWGGRGVGSALARGALADVRARGMTMTPQCPFIAQYLTTHPEELDLVGDAPG